MKFTQEDMENFARHYLRRCTQEQTMINPEIALVDWVKERDLRRQSIKKLAKG